MKRYLSAGIIIFLTLLFAGCATHRNPVPHDDLSREFWQQKVDTRPDRWAQGADRWFFTGDPNLAESMNAHAPYSSAISTMNVSVPTFTGVTVGGDFQVQLYSTYDRNCVSLYGPNKAVREIAVEVRNGMLYVTQSKNAPAYTGQVIVRIGVMNLKNLIQRGRGRIEGRQIRSSGLSIASFGKGNIYLAGPMNLWRISTNCAMVSVFGAVSGGVDIRTSGTGCVNVSGNIAVRCIIHRGTGNVNILGACGDHAKIYADGKGKIGLNGRVGFKEIKAKGRTCVYAYPVMISNMYAYAYDNAHIGLAGCAQDIYVDTSGSSRFEGRDLCAQNAYVRAREWSHINVTATNRIFASATQNASVYFFGTPNLMSQFVSGNGIVMPIWQYRNPYCVIPAPYAPSYKGENLKGESLVY